jgi:hypothetical protein
MGIAILLAILMLGGTLTVSAQNPNSQPTPSNASNTLTGCLKGSEDQYYIVEKNGHRHTLQAKGQDLSSHVNHMVTLSGKTSPSRSAGSSSDAEGNRSGFFSVDNVTDDQGACKKK